MAQINNKKNHLKKEYNKAKIQGYLYKIMAFISIVLIPSYLCIAIVLIPTFYMISKRKFKRAEILNYGLIGELQALKILKQLPNHYTTLSDLTVKYEGSESQTDHIVIGGNGVFVIEIKNLKGTIIGKDNQQHILHIKNTKKNKEYTKEIYNPVKQVATHVYKIAKILKSNGINTWVQGIVYFSNEDAKVDILSREIPVFSFSQNGDKQLIKYIKAYENEQGTLTKKIQNEIIKSIKNSAK